MAHSETDEESSHTWLWLAAAATAALAAVGAAYLIRFRDPAHRMDRLLRRCEARMHNLEAYLTELESSLGAGPPAASPDRSPSDPPPAA